MQKRFVLTLAVAAIAIAAFGLGAYAATSYGTQSDPLVSLSYLTEKLTPEVLAQVTEEMEFHVVTLSNGQQLTSQVGCELLLRTGSAVCKAGDSPGLVDSSAAAELQNGDILAANHLYLVTIQGHGLTATADNTKVLVKGKYSIS